MGNALEPIARNNLEEVEKAIREGKLDVDRVIDSQTPLQVCSLLGRISYV